MPTATEEHLATTPRLPSARKRAAARANGAKARGCKTEAGKRASSLNAMKHGLTAATVVIAGEDPRQYEAIRAAYAAFFNPQNIVEADLLDDMLAAKWRQRRALAIEAAILEVEIERQRPQLARDFEALSNDVRTALAFEAKSTRGASLPSLLRHEGRLSRQYLRALRTLLELRSSPPPPDTVAAESDTPAPPRPPAPEPPAQDRRNENRQDGNCQNQNCANEANPELGHCAAPAAPRFVLRRPPPTCAVAAGQTYSPCT